MISATVRVFLLGWVLCAMAGCPADGPMFKEADHAAGSAVIYVYRQSGYGGSAVTLNITVDGQPIGGLKPNGYVYKVVPPGTHMVSCKTESDSAVQVLAQAGQSYYIEGEVVVGFWVGEPKLAMVAADIGRANVGGKHLSLEK